MYIHSNHSYFTKVNLWLTLSRNIRTPKLNFPVTSRRESTRHPVLQNHQWSTRELSRTDLSKNKLPPRDTPTLDIPTSNGYYFSFSLLNSYFLQLHSS